LVLPSAPPVQPARLHISPAFRACAPQPAAPLHAPDLGRALPGLPRFPKEQLVFTTPITYTDGSYASGVGGAAAVRVHPDGRSETLAEGTFPGAQSLYQRDLTIPEKWSRAAIAENLIPPTHPAFKKTYIRESARKTWNRCKVFQWHSSHGSLCPLPGCTTYDKATKKHTRNTVHSALHARDACCNPTQNKLITTLHIGGP
jgi:hypothetical protein